MPSAAIFHRLKALSGANPREWEPSHLSTMVEAAVREDEDLDFKRSLYGNGESERRELAGDLASFANHRGGVIVLGVEDENDVAARLEPVPLSEGEEARIRQIAAGNIFPHLAIEIRVVPTEANRDRGFYVLIVPPSALRPHAVRKGRDLRYPRRDGTTTRWLGEAEVADLYFDRFRSVGDQMGRIEQVFEQGFNGMAPHEGWAQLAVALVPSSDGHMALSFEKIDEIQQWAAEPNTPYWRGFFTSTPRSRTGIRKVKLGSVTEERLPTSEYAELHADGAGFCCEDVGRADPQVNDPDPPCEIPGQLLLWTTAKSLRILGKHAAENAGAWGEVTVEARLIGSRMNLTHPTHRGLFSESWNHRPLDGPLVSRHTLPLESLVESDQELLAATRLVATDHFNGFGAPEVREIGPDGRIRIRHVHDQDRVAQMAEMGDVELDLE